MNETAQETTAVTATLVEHEPEMLPINAKEKQFKLVGHIVVLYNSLSLRHVRTQQRYNYTWKAV